MLMILGFHRFGCPVAQGLVQALRVPPRDPPERRQFQVLQIREGSAPPYQLGPVRAVGALGHGVAVRVADRAGRGKHAEFPDPGGVHEAGAPRAMAGTVRETVRAAMRAAHDTTCSSARGGSPWCPWRWRTPGRRSRGRARRRRTSCSRSVRDLLRLHRLHSASALDHLRIRLTRLIDLRQRTLTTGLRISRRPRIAITSRDHPRVTPPANAITHTPATNGTSQRGRRRTTSFSTLFSLIVKFFLPGIPYHPPRHRHGPVRSRPREAAERSETAHNVRARNTQG